MTSRGDRRFDAQQRHWYDTPGMTAPADKPVRLKVQYKSAHKLLNEFTRSVGRGGVSLESQRPLPVGTHFIFELVTPGVEKPVEVHGHVVAVTPAGGKHLLHIRYDAGSNRDGLDGVLEQIFHAQRYETKRKHPRVPLNVRANDGTAASAVYVIRDVSRGGLGIELETGKIPNGAKLGAPFLVEMTLIVGVLQLYGEVVWVKESPEEARWIKPGFGAAFGKLRPETVTHLERILELEQLPPPPWSATLFFGMDAVARMP
jgi:hypothetical protein